MPRSMTRTESPTGRLGRGPQLRRTCQWTRSRAGMVFDYWRDPRTCARDRDWEGAGEVKSEDFAFLVHQYQADQP